MQPLFYIKNTHYYLLFVIFLFSFEFTLCQTNDTIGGIPFVRNINNTSILSISKNVFGNAWIEFKDELNIDPLEIFNNYKIAFGLTDKDQMILTKTSSDELGMTHYKFQQYHIGIKVEGGEYIVHSINNKAIRANGKLVENINISPIPIVDSIAAIQIALDTIGKIKNINNFEAVLSKTELIYTKIGNSSFLKNTDYKLSYKLIINSSVNHFANIIYIDAINSKILKIVNNEYGDVGCQTGSVNTTYYGDQNFQIWQNLLGYHYLQCGGFSTLQYISGNYQWNNNPNDYWGVGTDSPSATVHWSAQMAWNYFLNVFQRWGPDENGTMVWNYVGGPNYNNETGYIGQSYPTLSPQRIYIESPIDNLCSSPASLEIVGHEYSHCVIYNMANLDPSNGTEYGALCESFCDIFGKMIEFYALNYFTNWEMGTNVFYSTAIDSKRRSFTNPNIYNDAASYGDAFWNASTDKYVRNGVQNHWFYLLAEGGFGYIENNINNPPYCINGIGKEKAASIVYYSLNNNLTMYSDYTDARNASISSAIGLFGAGSNEVAQVTQAWYAVGVGPAYNGLIEINNHTVSGTEYISYNNTVVFNNLQVTPTGNLTVTSNTRIVMNANSKSSSGSYFHAYITPACPGGARLTNSDYSVPSYDNNETAQTLNSKDNKDKLLLVPNPNTGKFTLQIINSSSHVSFEESKIIKTISIYDMIGKVVYQSTNIRQTQIVDIDISNLKTGIYFIKVQSGDKVYTDKVIVESQED